MPRKIYLIFFHIAIPCGLRSNRELYGPVPNRLNPLKIKPIGDEYVVVNIWPSRKNEALVGANVGHVSLSIFDGTTETYVSLWPHGFKQYSPGLFESVAIKNFPEYYSRPPKYPQDYEKDCILEARSEKHVRAISHIDECQEGETPYCFNSRPQRRLG